MTKYYKCNICGNYLKVEKDGGAVPTCCGQTMEVCTEECKDNKEEDKKKTSDCKSIKEKTCKPSTHGRSL